MTATELKCSDEALKASEVRYRRLFETVQDGILILDAELGEILDVNPFMMEMLGYNRSDFLGKKLWETSAFKDIDGAKAYFGELQTQGYVRYKDISLKRKDGRVVAVEFVSQVVKLDQKNIIHFHLKDITERKFVAEALQKVRNELEQRVQERTAELQTALSEIKTIKEQLEAENIYLRNEMESKDSFRDIVGDSDPIKYVMYRMKQVAPTKTSILLTGETGTGKGVFARLIHGESDRRDKPFVNVNCAGLPSNLIESELFGREKGAFTGSNVKQIGRFELANNGTIFLDEIGELPMELQAKLLKVIEDGEFERLGSPRSVKVDVRIIASTNRILEEEIKKGGFRQDLYYRLGVFPITIPPLRDRKEDIPLLVEFFVEKFNRRYKKGLKKIPHKIMQELESYNWPGNIRELRNVIERSVIISDGPQLRLAEKISFSPSLSASMSASKEVDEKGEKELAEVEKKHIMKTLEEVGWRIEGASGAAKLLGMNPSTMRARMRKHGIRRPGSE
jgi:formate hydrogenlyase transcriptional activator